MSDIMPAGNLTGRHTNTRSLPLFHENLGSRHSKSNAIGNILKLLGVVHKFTADRHTVRLHKRQVSPLPGLQLKIGMKLISRVGTIVP